MMPRGSMPGGPWKAIVQVITIAAFRRPENPRTCNVHRYHVWRWQGERTQPVDGHLCACGLLEWTHRDIEGFK